MWRAGASLQRAGNGTLCFGVFLREYCNPTRLILVWQLPCGEVRMGLKMWHLGTWFGGRFGTKSGLAWILEGFSRSGSVGAVMLGCCGMRFGEEAPAVPACLEGTVPSPLMKLLSADPTLLLSQL